MHRLVACLLVALLFFAPRIARACQCARSERVEDAHQRAAAVFEIDVGERGDGRVLRVWKGEVPARITIGPTDCPPTPSRGRWLVYGYDGGGIWHADMCGRSRPIEKADEDLAFLGAASPPFQDAPPTPAPRATSGDPLAGPPMPPPEAPRASSCACRSAGAGSPDIFALACVALFLFRARAKRS